MSTITATEIKTGDRFEADDTTWTVDCADEQIDGRVHVLVHDEYAANVSMHFTRDAKIVLA